MINRQNVLFFLLFLIAAHAHASEDSGEESASGESFESTSAPDETPTTAEVDTLAPLADLTSTKGPLVSIFDLFWAVNATVEANSTTPLPSSTTLRPFTTSYDPPKKPSRPSRRRTRSTLRQGGIFANRPGLQNFLQNRPLLSSRFPNRRRTGTPPIPYDVYIPTTPQATPESSGHASSPININLALYLYNNGEPVAFATSTLSPNTASVPLFSQLYPLVASSSSTTDSSLVEDYYQYDELTDNQVQAHGGLGNFKPLHQKEKEEPVLF